MIGSEPSQLIYDLVPHELPFASDPKADYIRHLQRVGDCKPVCHLTVLADFPQCKSLRSNASRGTPFLNRFNQENSI